MGANTDCGAASHRTNKVTLGQSVGKHLFICATVDQTDSGKLILILEPSLASAILGVRLEDESYNAREPWVQKRRWDEGLATELRQYIDDLRITAKTKGLAWAASSRIAKTCCWLGLQDDTRKRREPSQRPGAWAGASVFTDWDNAYNV
jgi:hypothetical protein